MPKILLSALSLVVAGFALWGFGVFDSGDSGGPSKSGGPQTPDLGTSSDVEPGKGTSPDSGGQVKLDKAPEIKTSKDPKTAPSKRKGIGNTGKAPHGAAIFPDGTWLPPLNGVEIAPPFPGFAPDFPYAPVVEIIEGDKGISWYIHADGSHSSTQLVETQQGGRTFTQAGWAVGNPTKTLPVDLPSRDGKKVKTQLGPRATPPGKTAGK